MSAKVYKLYKDSLTEVSSKLLNVSNVQILTIQHIHDNSISDEATISFEIEIDRGHVPHIYEEEFMIVLQERVDATSRGVNDVKLTNVDEDLGSYQYNKSVPYRPWELPQGFRELKGKNE